MIILSDFILLIIVSIVKIKARYEICDENNGKPEILEATRPINTQTVILMTKQKNFYEIIDFRFDERTNEIRFSDVIKKDKWSQKLNQTKLLFPMKYIKSGEIKLIAITFETVFLNNC